jgi:predicted ATP-grasp superfamily ATP-dependent carboligase
VLPVSEPAILALLAVRESIPAVMPLPGLSTFRAICDKQRVLATARDLGIAVPRQWEMAAPGQVPEPMHYPVVLKPARSVYTAPDGRRGKVGVQWARSREELGAALQNYPAPAFPVLIQERVVGPGTGIFVLLHDGKCLASFSHLRLREKPPSGGVSVACRSEPMDEALLQRSLELLRRFEWSGVAMVEYKRDAATDQPFLMEVNGRFWGSLQLAIDAGVDFPRLLVDVALGQEIPAVNEYRPARIRWLWGDVDHVIARWRSRDGGWRDRVAAVFAWFRAFGPGYREEVFRLRDPRPFGHETRAWLQDVLRRGPKKFRRSRSSELP